MTMQVVALALVFGIFGCAAFLMMIDAILNCRDYCRTRYKKLMSTYIKTNRKINWSKSYG